MAERNEDIDQMVFDAEPTSYLNIQILKCEQEIEEATYETFDLERMAELEGKVSGYS